MRSRSLGLVLSVVALTGLAYETDALKPFPFLKPVPPHLRDEVRAFQGCPSVTASPKGRLWAGWISGDGCEGDGNVTIVVTSGDGGKTWSKPVFAIDRPGPLRSLDPGFWTDPDGHVWIFWGQIYSFWDGRAGLWASRAADPEDPDTAWTPPVRLSDGYLKNKPTVLSNGTWLFPVEFMPYAKPIQGDQYHMEENRGPFAYARESWERVMSVYASTDKGRSLALLGRSFVPERERCYPEHMIVERRDGSLLMFGRTRTGIARSESLDGGRTWSPMAPFEIKNPNTRFHLRRLKSGALVLVKNGPLHERTSREQITVYVSDDDGQTWTGGLVLDGRKNVSYPDLTESADGFLHVVNDFEREKAREIVHHRFTEADVRAGRLVTPGSRLGDLVSRAGTARAPRTEWNELPREVRGRKVDLWWQRGDPARGESKDARNLVIVQHPVPGRERDGAPLYVVLHSAGHDALAALECTRKVHNHDIYAAPDDFYALYLDCRAYSQADWWWGAKAKTGFEETPCEKRVIATVRETVARYRIDPDRVYLCGNSMGGSGTLGIGLRHGDVFAAVKANVPAIRANDHPFKALGLPPYALPAGAQLPDPPPLVDYSAPDDGWSDNHERLIPAMRERKYAWFLYWGAFGHADNDPVMLAKNDIIHSFDWLAVRRDEPYPVFTDASSDDPAPWPHDRASRRPGQLNGFFRWSAAAATARELRLTLSLDDALKSRFFTVPESSTVDVTPRRLGAFAVKPGDRVAWRFGAAKGVATVGADGLFTIPHLAVTKTPTALVCTRE